MKFAELTQEVQVARSQQIRFDLGLTPGRRRLNKQYKDALSRARENGGRRTQKPPSPSFHVCSTCFSFSCKVSCLTVDPDDLPVPEPLVYSLGAALPVLQYIDTIGDDTLQELTELLKQRELKRSTLLADYAKKRMYL